MLSITDLKVGTKIIFEGDPWTIVFAEHSKMGRGGAIMRTKMKNLITGATVSRTFQGSEKFDPADLNKKSAQFLYKDETSAYFMDNENYEQFELPVSQIAESVDYLSENSVVDILYFKDKAINIELPIKMIFAVTDAPPSVRGNSAGSVTKLVTLETGKQVGVPLFIKAGDKIVVDTRTGNYLERSN